MIERLQTNDGSLDFLRNHLPNTNKRQPTKIYDYILERSTAMFLKHILGIL